MSELEASRKERTTIKRKLTRNANILKTLISQSVAQPADVEAKFQEVKLLWSNLQDKHDNYIALLPDDDEEKVAEEDSWLDDAQTQFEALQIEVMALKGNNEQEKLAALKRNALVARELEQATLNNMILQINGLMAEENTNHDQLQSLSTNVDEQIEKCQIAQKEYLALSPDESIESAIKWNDDNRSRTAAVQLRAAEKLKAFSKLSGKSMGLTTSKNNLRLERMQMPKFDGKMRDYPRFKADFERQVMPEMRDKYAAAYVLKTCLTGASAEIVRNVDDDIEEMWRRLDDRYGRPHEIDRLNYLRAKKRKVRRGE